MTLRRMQLSAVAVVLFTLFLAAGVAQPNRGKAAVRTAAITKASAAPVTVDWVFEGCWTQLPSGPCRDVYRDAQGNYYVCRECGTTGKPGPGKCNPISQTTLSSGLWCS